MNEQIATITFEVGRLLCGQVRNALNVWRFNGTIIDYFESRGFLSRTFSVKVYGYNAQRVLNTIQYWESE